ncbi:MAG: hypothetical protein ABFS16_02110 [Bacteroidota bacterium]
MENKRVDLPVNWIDGMKINKDHFIATDNNITQQIKDTYLSFINPFNYGLLLQDESNNDSLKIIIDIDNQSFIHAKVLSCKAITRSGSRIEIQDNYFTENDLSQSIPKAIISAENKTDEDYYIALSVDPFERVPFGVPLAEENPPRLPNVLPGYSVTIHKKDELNSVGNENSLIIGKLQISDNKPELDDTFIPPCQTIYSHPKLVEYHSQLVKILGQIEIDIVDILRRIKDKKQATTIAQTVAEVADSMLGFMSVHMVEFRRIAKYKPPVYIFEQIATLARVVNNSINKQSSTDREELLNYIQDWSSLNRGVFEELISNAIEYKYNHDDINSSINTMAPFVNAISGVCNTLSNLDFIGKKKDRHIFVKEQKEKPGGSFLVD